MFDDEKFLSFVLFLGSSMAFLLLVVLPLTLVGLGIWKLIEIVFT